MQLLALPLALLLFRGWVGGRPEVLISICVLIFTAVTSFIIGVRMRREIKKSLGRKATDEDLSDIDTWIEVRDAEEKSAAKKPPHLK